MVGSRLFDQRDAKIQLIKIVQNLIDSGDDFASMFLEGVMNMLVCCVSDQIGIHEGKHVDNLIVGLKDAKIAHDWLYIHYTYDCLIILTQQRALLLVLPFHC